MEISPSSVRTHPGSRVVFGVTEEGQTVPLSNGQYEVLAYVPGREPENATIHETDNTFSYVVPPVGGDVRVSFLIKRSYGGQTYESWVHVDFEVDPAESQPITFTNSVEGLQYPAYMDLYDPRGNLVHTESFSSPNHTMSVRPAPEWIEGEYRVVVRDQTGLKDVDALWMERPDLISMPTFFSLANWQRQLLEYLKYEMLSDTAPLHPEAYFTLEEYAKHWVYVVDEINNVPFYTRFSANSVPFFWANVMLKGTLCRVYQALANRSVTIPRWNGVPTIIRDESHLQSSWQERYQQLRPEYEEERAYLKGLHSPKPAITVDPWLGWGGGNITGTAGLALIGRPTWFVRNFGIRG